MSRLLAELAALEPAPDWLRLLYLQPDGIDRRASGGPCGARRALRGRPPPARLRRRPAPHAALRRRRRASARSSSASAPRCPAPPSAPRSSPGSPARPTRSSTSSSPSCATPRLAVAGVFVYDEQEGTAAAGMPGAVPHELALERAAHPRRGDRPRGRALLVGPRRRHGRRPRGARHVARRTAPRSAASRSRRPDVDGRTTVRGARVAPGRPRARRRRATPSGMMWRPSPRQGEREQPAEPRQQHHHRADPARPGVPGDPPLGPPAALRRPPRGGRLHPRRGHRQARRLRGAAEQAGHHARAVPRPPRRQAAHRRRAHRARGAGPRGRLGRHGHHRARDRRERAAHHRRLAGRLDPRRQVRQAQDGAADRLRRVRALPDGRHRRAHPRLHRRGR